MLAPMLATLYTCTHVHSCTIPNCQRPMGAQVINTPNRLPSSLQWEADLHTLQPMLLEDLCARPLSLVVFPGSPWAHLEGPGREQVAVKAHTLHVGCSGYVHLRNAYIKWGVGRLGVGMGRKTEHPLKSALPVPSEGRSTTCFQKA